MSGYALVSSTTRFLFTNKSNDSVGGRPVRNERLCKGQGTRSCLARQLLI
jgi:hypothetical protein